MSVRLALALLISVLVASTRLESQRAADTAYVAFVDANVISMSDEGVAARQTVLVRGDRIERVGPAGSVALPAGAIRIDARGKFLMPGLGDAHAHLSSGGGGATLAERALEISPLFGVTMMRSMYTEPHHRVLLAQAGERAWPRVVMASPPLSGQTAPTPQSARDSLRSFKSQGFTIGKIMPGLSRASFDALVEEARVLQVSLAGHVPASVGLEHALSSRLASIEHLDGMLEALARPGVQGFAQSGFFGFGLLDQLDASQLARIVAAVKASGVVMVPTELEMERFTSPESGAELAARREMQLVPQAMVRMWEQQKDNSAGAFGVTRERHARYRDLRRRVIRELHLAGAPIAAGSDAFNLFDVPGAGLIEELEVYVAAGLSRWDALKTATVNAARLLALPAVTGTVAAGSVADLVLLDRNPLDDLAHLRQPVGVMLNGRWLDRAALANRYQALIASRDAR